MTPRNFHWSIHPKPEPTDVQRLARVLHWCLTASAAAATLGAIADADLGLLSVAAASFIFLRELRYIVASE